MRKRLMVTGADGFIAGNVVQQALGWWEVHALALERVAYPGEIAPDARLQTPNSHGLHWHVFDLRDADRLRHVFREVHPDVFVHAAALADIDYCETHKDAAESVNVCVVRDIVRHCRQAGAKLVFLSTDTVFDGTRGFYREDDPPRPRNFYAETKVRAERVVTDTAGNAVIARLSLVMGLPALGAGNSFMARMIEALKDGREVGMPDNEIRTPIDVITLGRALLELADNDFAGCIHLAGNDRLSRHAMGQRIAERLGYPKDLVVVKNAEALLGRAPRPRDVSLDNAKARAFLKTPMRSLDGGLDLVLETSKGTPT